MDAPKFWGSSSLPSIILFLCHCALNVTVWLAFSSSILSSTLPDSKVLWAGARSIALVEGKMAKEREREKPRASYHSVGHVAEMLHGCKKRKLVFDITISSWSCDTSICLNRTASDMKSMPVHILLSLGYESQNKSVLSAVETNLHLCRKAQIMLKTCQWFARWTVTDGAWTRHEVFLNTQRGFVINACLHWLNF